LAISFQYSHEFKGKRADEVYEKVMAWLTKEEARKVVSTKPTSIEAIHGSHKTMKGWNRNAKKKLSIFISPSPSGVTASATASPTMANSSDVAQMSEDARLNWGLLIEECWAAVDGKVTTENAERIKLERTNLMAVNREAGKRMLVYGSLGMVLVFAAMFAIVGLADISLPRSFFVIPGTLCGLTAFWGATKMRSK
jgi:hypothetical protein